jgi:hypothetical protein
MQKMTGISIYSYLLVEHFRSDECTVIREPDGRYYLKSDYFRGHQDHKKVITSARPLMEHMNGIAKVIAPWFRPVNSDKLTSIHENGNRGIVLLAGPIQFRLPPQIPPREPLLGRSPPLGKAEALIQLAKDCRRVADTLRIFGTRPPTWSNLYNVYELVREDVGGEQKIANSGWIEKDELASFKATANDPSAIGDDARHQKRSSSKKSPKKQIMSHDEAREFLHQLLNGWLVSKI